MKNVFVKSLMAAALVSTSLGSSTLSAVSKSDFINQLWIGGYHNTKRIDKILEECKLETVTDEHIYTAKALMTFLMSTDERLAILEVFSKIPVHNWREFQSTASLLVTKDMDGYERARAIDTLASVPANNWKDFQSIASLLAKGIDGYARASVISALASVPANNWKDFQSMVSPLVTRDMNGDARARVISALASVPANNWKDLQSITSLLVKDIDGDARAHFISTFASVPTEQLEYFTSLATLLMHHGMSGHECAMGILTLIKIPNENRKELVSTADVLVPEAMSEIDGFKIIHALASVSQRSKARVYQQIQNLVSRTGVKFNEYQHAVSLIQTLSQFDDAQKLTAFVNGVIRLCERDNVVVNGNRLLTHMQTMKTRMSGMNNDEVMALLGYGQSTHKKEVHESIAVSLGKLKDRYTDAFKVGDVFYLIAQQLENLPRDTKEVFQEALSSLKAKYSSTNVPEMIDSLLKINPYTRAGQNNEDTVLNQSTREALTAYPGNEELRKDVTKIVSRYARLKDHEHALTALEFMKETSTFKDATSNLGYFEMLSLIYAGIHDPQGSITGETLSDKDREERWLTFRNRLAKARNEYGDSSASCTSGYFNAAVEALDGTHPDVHIIHSFRALMQEIALEKDDEIYEDRINVALSHLGPNAAKDTYYQEEIKVWRDAREDSKEADTEDKSSYKLGLSSTKPNEEDN